MEIWEEGPTETETAVRQDKESYGSASGIRRQKFQEGMRVNSVICSIKIKVDENYEKDRKYIFRSLKTFEKTFSEM